MTEMPHTPFATLVVLPFFPDDHTGAGQRSRLMLEAASRCGPAHVVVLQNRRHKGGELPGAASITLLNKDEVTPRKGLERLHVGLARLVAPDTTYRVQPALRAALLALIRQHEVKAVLFRYTHLHCAAGLGRADELRVLVDVDDRDDQKYASALSNLFGRYLGRGVLGPLLLRRMARGLRARLSQAVLVWFVTDEDVWPLLPPTQTAVLPNVPYWTVPDLSHAPPSASRDILFVGIHDHRPNRDGVAWFLDRCWPRIAAGDPSARLRIVGRGDWAAMARARGNLPNVTFVGEVDDLSTEYARARLCICPVHEGGGSKIKVVEAAAFGRPIVLTPHALRGFEGIEGLDLPRDEDPVGFAAACLAFLADGARADRAGAAFKVWQQDTWSREAFVARAAAGIQAERSGMA
jgi:glycosyltransferase involved in cell wall biosynthesis